jgi:hypothetical protein
MLELTNFHCQALRALASMISKNSKMFSSLFTRTLNNLTGCLRKLIKIPPTQFTRELVGELLGTLSVRIFNRN